MTHILPEYAKGQEDLRVRSTIELFPDAVDFMGVIPFCPAPGGVMRYQEESALPSNMAFRAINETPTTGYGLLTDRVEQCFPIAGNVDVDRVLINRHGPSRRATEERMEIKKKAKVWADTFIDGDNQTAPREFTGMKARLKAVGSGTASVDGSNYLSRILANDTSSGGGPLSLKQLDRAIGLVEEPNAIIMPKALLDRMPAASRDTGIGGFITFDKNEMGKRIARYGDLPIYTGYGVTKFGEFLPFTEADYAAGGTSCSSVYVVRFAEDGVCALETSPMEVTDIGLMENGVHYRLNIEHDVGMSIMDPFSAIRMSSVTNAAIVK